MKRRSLVWLLAAAGLFLILSTRPLSTKRLYLIAWCILGIGAGLALFERQGKHPHRGKYFVAAYAAFLSAGIMMIAPGQAVEFLAHLTAYAEIIYGTVLFVHWMTRAEHILFYALISALFITVGVLFFMPPLAPFVLKEKYIGLGLILFAIALRGGADGKKE